jgi:hypothetical protein
MPPRLARFATPVAIAVLILAGASLARASIDELAAAQTFTFSAPSLLGPISALGRSGWDCAPERAARASNPRAAELPDDTSH